MTHPAPHLNPRTMAAAQRHLVAKALAEFAHERLLAPVRVDEATAADDVPGTYEVALADRTVVYRFRVTVQGDRPI